MKHLPIGGERRRYPDRPNPGGQLTAAHSLMSHLEKDAGTYLLHGVTIFTTDSMGTHSSATTYKIY